MKKTTIYLTTALACIGLPLAGVVADGRNLAQYLEFPPLTRYVAHSGFSFPLFCLIALIDLAMVVPLALALWRRRTTGPSVSPAISPDDAGQRLPFPWWGWLGIGLTATAWLLAWTRFPWFTPFQRHTFTPLWIGYILVINALVYQRSGTCPLTGHSLTYGLLFPLSALFWWLFEYFNRFVQNWYYLGVQDFNSAEYIVYASISFSTVLPAVVATRALLLTFRPFAELRRGMRLRLRQDLEQLLALILLLISLASLLLVGVFPDFLFPFLWISPLLVFETQLILAGHPSLLTRLKQGDWHNLTASAAAALLCGFFWELWNFQSLAKWVYAIPFVDRFHIFEMPLLGFGGYLPFGLECTVLADIVFEALSQRKRTKRMTS